MDDLDLPEATEEYLSEEYLNKETQDVYAEDVYDVPPPVPDMSMMSMMPEPDVFEEDALTVFNKQWKAALDIKLAAEFAHEKQARTKATEDHQSWATQREIRLTAKKESNRSEEQTVLETVESEVELLKTWDRVGKLIDGGVEASELKKGSDTSRMHKLFIQLKNEPLEKTRLETTSVQ